MSKNVRVVLNEKGYPEKNGIATLIGIYPTMAEANFIANIVNTKYKTSADSVLEITEVDSKKFPTTSTLVADFFKRQRQE